MLKECERYSQNFSPKCLKQSSDSLNDFKNVETLFYYVLRFQTTTRQSILSFLLY